MGSPTERRTILFWNTHRGWTEAFAAGRHRYLNPVAEQPSSADGSHDGSPSGVEEIGAAHLRDEDVDLVVQQNPDELELTARWLAVGRASMFPPSTWSTTPAAVRRQQLAYPLGGRNDIPIVHSTDFNRVMWNNGSSP
ncbi:MAG TPA: hypothetical protein VET27_09995 [Mycobacterium sp.]|nr:hypothetical protein [Mycobacterium sp.]